jgi:hypothetical protein
MRTAVITGTAVAMLAAPAALIAAGGRTEHRGTVARAIERTAQASRERYTTVVTITRTGSPTVLHINGTVSPGAIFVRVRLGGGGPNGAALLDDAFYYERAPSYLHVTGPVQWQRASLSTLGPEVPVVSSVSEMTPSPLLRVVGRANRVGAPGMHVFRGTIEYDDPAVADSLRDLMDGVQFRHLRVTAWLGKDGLVHGIRIVGRTADSRTTFAIQTRLFAFARPVHLAPPAAGTFFDRQLARLAA